MELTGKCKKDFEKWFLKDVKKQLKEIVGGWFDKQILNSLYNTLTNSMRYGVYVDWFDSVGIYIDLEIHSEPTMSGLIFKSIRPNILGNRRFYNVGASFGKRDRARTEAIKKANEIYNE